MIKKKRRGFCSIAFVLFLAFLFAGIASAILYFNSLPPISQLQNYEPTLVSQIVSSDNTVLKTFGVFNYKKVDINDIPETLKQAIIATEDKNFYTHQGFDLVALIRSTLSNLMAGRVVQGASTITQQLARILFLSTEKTFDRKIKELIIAHRLEKTLPKDEILGMYLNNVYLGEGAYGVSAASEVYFNKTVENLTLSEAALIAGLPQAPSLYSPYQNLEYAKSRRSQVLHRMLTMNYINQEEFDEANDAPIKLNKTHRPYLLNKAPYFTNYVMKELREKAGLSEQEIIQGGYKIYTTLNYSYQKAAEDKVVSNMSRWGLRKSYQQAAVISCDVSTGKILAYVGGKDYSESQFDRASQSVRQPGSSFKPFVYATAMERGLTPQTIYNDVPLKVGEWSPHNYGGRYRGKIPLYKALAFSSNVIASRLILDVGVGNTIDMARRLGITTPIANDPTIALGSSGVKLIEMTSAYGAIASGGIKFEPYAVERVETNNGRVIYEANSQPKRVLDTKVAAYLVEMMKQVITIGTGKAANIGSPVAGKTGTTDDYRDAWFIGFTPTVVTGVWVGNDNNTPTRGLAGGGVPARIWGQYMRTITTRPKSSASFSYPEITIQDKNMPNENSTNETIGTTEDPNAIEENSEESVQYPQKNIPPSPVDPNTEQDYNTPSYDSSQGSQDSSFQEGSTQNNPTPIQNRGY